MKRCVIYNRKSVRMRLDIEYNSLESQEDICKRFIEQRRAEGWEYCRTYCDAGVSGGSTERPALQEMLIAARRRKFDCVVVFKLDRLARRFRDFVLMLEELGEHGVEVISVTENFDCSGAMGKALRGMLGIFAELEREFLRERVQERADAARMKGLYLCGIPPFGYMKENRRLQPDPLRADAVRDMFTLCAEGIGATRIAEEMNRRKVPKQKRGSQPELPWRVDHVLTILHNPVYKGCVPCHDEMYQGVHEALVSVELWAQVQERLAANKKKMQARIAQEGPRFTYPLKGLLVCGLCGHVMRGVHSGSAPKKRRSYCCPQRRLGGIHACDCLWVSASRVERMMQEVLLHLPADQMQLLLQTLRNELPHDAQPTLRDMLRCLFSKIELHSHSYMLELHMNISPLGEAWSFPALQGDKATVQLDMPELRPVEPVGRPCGERPTMRAICMANAMKLEQWLLSGCFAGVKDMAMRLHIKPYILYRRLALLNHPPDTIEKLLFQTH